jgi:anti-sigma B factor antagonist
MDMSAETTAEGLVIRIEAPRLDAAAAIAFKEGVRHAALQPGSPVILDLSRVTFLDSSGLGAVVAVMKLLGPTRPLHLAGITPNVAKVFRLTRMDSVFTILPQAPLRARVG